MSKDHGVTGSRGAVGCGWFHEFAPGPDEFCDCCRPSPDQAKPAEDWIRAQGRVVPPRGTEEWGKALMDWVRQGRPKVEVA